MNKKEIVKLRKAQKNHKHEALVTMDTLAWWTESKDGLELLQWALDNPVQLTNETNMVMSALMAMGED